MKKILALVGSRNKNGNTQKFISSICDRLNDDQMEREFIFPQDYIINPCLGCGKCFRQAKCIQNDDLELVVKKILECNLLIIGSPVYVHYMSADLKKIIERISWWAHVLRLKGKPVVLLSTCSANGINTVIEPMDQYITMMGGNVIVRQNASEHPPQINSDLWLNKMANEISRKIMKFLYLPPQSNENLEKAFFLNKQRILRQIEAEEKAKIELGECHYWRNSGMLNYDSFSDYLLDQYHK